MCTRIRWTIFGAKKIDEDKIESFTDEQIEALLGACDQRTYVGLTSLISVIMQSFRDYCKSLNHRDNKNSLNDAYPLLEYAPIELFDSLIYDLYVDIRFNR
ncbi:hypothetical protein RCO48_14500 [Peribacillus frigoritolerans]|nr:hypothetical protein [Peribacillus frigoritolerans]